MSNRAAVALIESALELLSQALELVGGEQSECAHPPEQRENLSTLGGPEAWRCRACGAEITSPVEG